MQIFLVVIWNIFIFNVQLFVFLKFSLVFNSFKLVHYFEIIHEVKESIVIAKTIAEVTLYFENYLRAFIIFRIDFHDITLTFKPSNVIDYTIFILNYWRFTKFDVSLFLFFFISSILVIILLLMIMITFFFSVIFWIWTSSILATLIIF